MTDEPDLPAASPSTEDPSSVPWSSFNDFRISRWSSSTATPPPTRNSLFDQIGWINNVASYSNRPLTEESLTDYLRLARESWYRRFTANVTAQYLAPPDPIYENTRMPTAPAPAAALAEHIVQAGAHSRYSGIISTEMLENTSIAVIGLGAIGSAVLQALSVMGFRRFVIYDHDNVEAVNIGTQGYHPSEVGQKKATVWQKEIMAWGVPSSNILKKTVRATPLAFSPTTGALNALHETTPPFLAREPGKQVIVMAVDSLETRRRLFAAALKNSTADRPLFGLWLDARMSAEEFELYAVAPEARSVAIYLKSLEAESGPPMATASCTTRSTYYTSQIAGNFIVNHLVRWLRGDLLPRPVKMHIPSMTTDPMSYLYEQTTPQSGGNPAP